MPQGDQADKPESPLALVQSKLRELGLEKGSGQDWQCPAHDDEKASLGVTASVDGKVLLNCQAGCETPEVAKSLGLTMADLFPNRRPEVTYSYHDEQGRLLYQAIRKPDGKRYFRRPADRFAFAVNGEAVGEWEWKQGDRKVLYRLPNIIAAVRQGKTVWVAEGEKDASNLVTLAGVEATCNPSGAGSWRGSYSEALRGAHVVVVADRDDPGRDHARAVARSLAGTAASVRIVQPAIDKHKADASDHLEAGLGLEDFQPLDGDEDQEHDTEPLADLDDFLNGDEPEYDWIVIDLIERFDRVIFTGDEGSGKSVLRRQIGVCVAAGIHPFTGEHIDAVKVVEFDLENSRKQMRRKYAPLKELAGSRLKRGMLFPISKPEGIDLRSDDGKKWFERKLKRALNDSRTPGVPIGLVVAGPVYKMADGDPNQESDMKPVAKFLDEMRVKYGFALVLEAHTGNETKTSSGGRRRPKRPFGWSGWRRWAEFGMFISNGQPVDHWRGPRDERKWPTILEWSNDPKSWPWREKEMDKLGMLIAIALSELKRIPSIRELAERLGIDKGKIERHQKRYLEQWEQWRSDYGETDSE